jgi:hypothetical protein
VHRRHRLFGGYGRLLVEMINDQAGTRLRGAVASRADRCGTTGLACRGIAVGAECDRRLDVVVFAEGTAPAVTGELSWSSRWRPVQAEERRAEVVLARLPAGPPRAHGPGRSREACCPQPLRWRPRRRSWSSACRSASSCLVASAWRSSQARPGS